MLLSKINKNVRLFLLADGLYYGGYGMLNAFLAALITLHVAPERLDIVGFILSYYLVCRAISIIPLTKFTFRLSLKTKKDIVALCFLLHGIAVISLGFSTQIWHILVIETVLALSDSLSYPVKWPLFSMVQDENNKETEWGLEDLFAVSGSAIAAITAGIVSNIFGVRAIFFVFGSLFFFASLCFRKIDIGEKGS